MTPACGFAPLSLAVVAAKGCDVVPALVLEVVLALSVTVGVGIALEVDDGVGDGNVLELDVLLFVSPSEILK